MERKNRYALRKTNNGLVSCIVGVFMSATMVNGLIVPVQAETTEEETTVTSEVQVEEVSLDETSSIEETTVEEIMGETTVEETIIDQTTELVETTSEETVVEETTEEAIDENTTEDKSMKSTQDTTPPEIVSITADKEQYAPGDEIKITVIIKDESQLENMEYIYLNSEYRGYFQPQDHIFLNFNSVVDNEDGTFTLEYSGINSIDKRTKLYLSGISLNDEWGNYLLYDEIQENFFIETVRDINEELKAPEIIGIITNKKAYKTGEEVEVTLVVREDSEITSGSIIFSKFSNNGRDIFDSYEITTNERMTDGSLLLKFIIPIPEKSVNASYQLTFLNLYDKWGNSTTLENGNSLFEDIRFKIMFEPEIEQTIETEPIPYEIEIVETPSIPEGEEEIQQQGEPGILTHTTTQKVYGDEILEGPSTISEVTKEPVNEVVLKGTGKLTVETIKEIEEIPFNSYEDFTDQIPNMEYKIIQEGINGKREIIKTQNYLNGEPYGEPTVESDIIISSPVDQITGVGTGYLWNDTQYYYEDLEYETIYKENKNLPDGTKNILQVGQNGNKTWGMKYWYLNEIANPYGEPEKIDEVIVEAIPEIIEIGTGKLTTETIIESKIIPFEKIVEENPNLPNTEKNVIQVGLNGEKEITKTLQYLNGELYGEPIVENERIVIEPVNEIIEQGTSPYTFEELEQIEIDQKADAEAEEAKELSYSQETVNNIIIRDQETGIEIKRVTLNGESIFNRLNKIIYDYNKANGTALEIVDSYRTNTAVYTTTVNGYSKTKYEHDQLITVKNNNEIDLSTIKPEFIPDGLLYNNDYKGTLYKEIKIVNENQNTLYRNEEINQYTIDESIRNAMNYIDSNKYYFNFVDVNVGYIISMSNLGYYRGDKYDITVHVKEHKIDYVTNEEVKDIPFETVKRNNPDLLKGTEKVVQAGKKGQIKVTTTTAMSYGVPQGEPVVEETVVSQPLPQIIEIGTGVVTDKVEVTTEAIPFKTDRIETADLPEGEEKVQTVGVNGEQKITTTTPMLNNKPYGEANVSKETTKSPVNQVVLVGTGKIEQVVTTSTKPIPFTTEIVENPDLLKGEEKVIQEGVDGVMTITTTTPTWKGQVYGEVTTTEKVTTQPIEKIVEVGVGTIEVKEDIQTKPIAYETKIVENPNMLEGTEKVTQVGVEGELTITTKTQYLNGKVLSEPIVIKERTKEPVTEIIEKGIGVIEEKTEIAKIELPYETQYEVNTNLDKMGQQVKQAGVMGESIRITVTPYLNGKVYGEPVVTEEITKKPVTEVIEVGEGLVEPVIEKTTEAIDYETETIGNADLEVGVKNVKQAGVKGELTRTTTTYFIFGKQYGEAEVSEEITLEPVKEIIEVGTKVVEDKQSTEKTTDSESNKSEKPVKVNSATTLPNAGEIDYRQVFTPAALTILAGLGLIVTDKKRKPENE